MANYEKRVEQEAAYPIPISLYNCYRTVRHEERHSYRLLIVFLMPHCPVTVVQRYRDGVCSLLFHSFFIICHPYIPLHLEEMIFILVYILAAFFPATQVADKPRFTLSNTYTDSVYYTSPSACAHERGHVVCNVRRGW